MESRCPQCGDLSVVAQDIEVLSDSALLVKLSNRIQLCCQSCGWLACRDISLETELPSSNNSPPQQPT